MSKGDKKRPLDDKVFGENYDDIFRKKVTTTLTELFEKSEKKQLKDK